MSNDYFRFKQFTVRQNRCAMKVGTDGTLLGAWARMPVPASPHAGTGQHILDVGTGTGLIALMMAQRFPHGTVTGIDIDNDAATQAEENVLASPFATRINIEHRSLQCLYDHACPAGTLEESAHIRKMFSAIVCNPPYFTDSLECPDKQRSMARHASSLSYDELMHHSSGLLDPAGELSVIVPFDNMYKMNSAAAIAGLHTKRICTVKTTACKPPKRVLMAFGRHQDGTTETSELVIGSDGYNSMLCDFYLKIRLSADTDHQE